MAEPPRRTLSPWLEAHLGYPNSPRRVRWFWIALGAVLALGSIPAGLWIFVVLVYGALESLRRAVDAPFATAASVIILWLTLALRKRIPRFWR